jgi:putative membrane protein insertion efficiency factor
VNLLQHSLVLAIRVYRCTVSPAQLFLFGAGSGCRFTPTCSVYATEAILSHGALTGTWLTVKRLARCHPWGSCGHDPVPASESTGPGYSNVEIQKTLARSSTRKHKFPPFGLHPARPAEAPFEIHPPNFHG